jgi:hypothetical protein
MVKSNNKDKNGNANNKGTVITIVGGGNSAHVSQSIMYNEPI